MYSVLIKKPLLYSRVVRFFHIFFYIPDAVNKCFYKATAAAAVA